MLFVVVSHVQHTMYLYGNPTKLSQANQRTTSCALNLIVVTKRHKYQQATLWWHTAAFTNTVRNLAHLGQYDMFSILYWKTVLEQVRITSD